MRASPGLPLLAKPREFGVTPVSGFGFTAGDADIGAAEAQLQLLVLAPLLQLAGDLSRARMPAMVAVPKLQRPLVPAAEIPEQSQQRHRVLAAGDRQNEGAALGQPLRILQQLAVQPVVPVQPRRAGCHCAASTTL